MARPQEPLDETVARRDDVLNWWLTNYETAGFIPFPRYPMEERFIHRYFSETPFFDHTSKEGLIINQAGNDGQTFSKVHDRLAFEGLLRQRPGVEYNIVGDGEPVPGAPDWVRIKRNGVWVIRKVDRLQWDGPDPRSPRDKQENPFPETELLGTYFLVGPNAYQAPSVGDVVGNRLFSAATSLSKYVEMVSSLPSFSPTTGYSYLPQAQKRSGTASTTGSPSRSREGSVAPGTDSQSLRSGSLAPDSQQAEGTKASKNAQDARLLAQSLQAAIQFGEEYMDENPILGEPGSFKFTSSTAAVKKRKADEEAARVAAQKAKEAKSAAGTPAGSPKAEPAKAPTPPPVFTDAKSGGGATEKLKKEERKKRKRSKATLTSPSTPVSGNTPKATTPAG